MRLVATLTAFIVGAIGATAARWLGIQDSGLVVAYAVVGAGLQSIAFILLYLFRTRTREAPAPFGEPVRFDPRK